MLQHDDPQIAHRHLEPDCPRGLYRLPALTVGVLIRRSCDIQSGASNFQPDPVRLFLASAFAFRTAELIMRLVSGKTS